MIGDPFPRFVHGIARGRRDPGVFPKTEEQALRYLTLELKKLIFKQTPKEPAPWKAANLL